LTLLALSASGVGGKSCNIPAHARLEAMLKQAELLRRLDADAHAAMKAELERQLVVVQGELAAVTAATRPSPYHAPKSHRQVGHDGSHAAPAGDAAALAAAQAAAAEARAAAEANAAEAAGAKRQLAAAEASYSATIARYEQALAAAQAATNAAATTALTASHQVAAVGAAATASASGTDVHALESELSAAREKVRAGERRERVLQHDLRAATERAAHVAVLEEQLATAQRKVHRLERAAAVASTLAGRLTSAAATLDTWSSLMAIVAQPPPPRLPSLADAAAAMIAALSAEDGGPPTAASGDAHGAGGATLEDREAHFAAALAGHAHAAAAVRQVLSHRQEELQGARGMVHVAQSAAAVAASQRRILQGRVDELAAARDAALAEASAASAAAAKSERQIASLAMQVASLRGLVQTYEREYAAAPKPAQPGVPAAGGIPPPGPAVYFEAVGEALQHMQQCVAAVTGQLDAFPSPLAVAAADARASALASETAALRAEVEALYAVASGPDRDTGPSFAPPQPDMEAKTRGVDGAAMAKIAKEGGDPADAEFGTDGSSSRVYRLTAGVSATAFLARIAEVKAALAEARAENEALRAASDRSGSASHHGVKASVDASMAAVLKAVDAIKRAADASAASLAAAAAARASAASEEARAAAAKHAAALEEGRASAAQAAAAAEAERAALARTAAAQAEAAAAEAKRAAAEAEEARATAAAALAAPPPPAAGMFPQSSAPAASGGASAAPTLLPSAGQDKVIDRMKKLFKERLGLLQDMVYRLTGYRVDISNQKPEDPKHLHTVILRPLNAEQETVSGGRKDQRHQHSQVHSRVRGVRGGEQCARCIHSTSVSARQDHLAVEFDSAADKLTLAENDFTKRLDPSLFVYLRMSSFPAFTAAITLHLADKVTSTAGGGDIAMGLS